MDPKLEKIQSTTRRHFLKDIGIGAIALSTFLHDGMQSKAANAVNPLVPKPPHFTPKAKRVVYLHMTGSPPNLDIFDYKPELIKRDGQDCPDAFLEGKRFAFTSGVPKLMGTRREFARYGKHGIWLSGHHV